MSVLTQPFHPFIQAGITELIGADEQVNQNDYSASVGVALPYTMSGEILSVCLYSSESGSGSVQSPEGWLYIFDADPTIAAGDTAMTLAERRTVLGRVKIESADWETDANGGTAYIVDTPIPFHEVSSLFFAFKLTSATSLNDAAGDDEQLQFDAWLRRDS